MAHSRSKLSKILHRILGSDNVYYQPPESIKIEYDAIIYSKGNVNVLYADNRAYNTCIEYTITCISPNPDCLVAQKIMDELPRCSYVRRYTKDNLYYEVLRTYF